MSEHREGTLFYDTETGRYDIRFDLESFYGGLHCGECFDVKVKNVWVPVRIEMGDDWYLVGLNVSRLDGLRVRTVSYTHLLRNWGSTSDLYYGRHFWNRKNFR